MTLIRLNGEELSYKYNANSTLSELVDQLLSGHLTKEEVITAISINGKTLSGKEESECLPKSLNEFQSIDLKAQSNLELAFDALDSCNGYIDVLTEKVQDLVLLYQDNKIDEANDKFSDIIEIVDLFVQLMTKINRTLKSGLGQSFQKSRSVQNLEIHLLSIVKGLLPAKENNDIIMLCDLLEYELIDNLTQWKIKAIPELKNLQKR
jgi:hypothetical protein